MVKKGISFFLVLCTTIISSVIVFADNSVKWTAVQDPGIKGLNDVIYGKDLIVAVGEGSRSSTDNYGAILTSTDGIHWTNRITGTNNPLFGAAWSGNMYVVVGKNQTILTSKDGAVWTKRASGSSYDLTDVVWAGNQFVAVGTEGTIITSSDGITWTPKNSGSKANFTGIAWSGNQLVAIGQTPTSFGDNPLYYCTSQDGTNWVEKTLDIKGTLNDIVWSGSQFVAVGGIQSGILSSKGGLILTSPDGLSWTKRTVNVNDEIDCITWSGKTFLAFCNNLTLHTITSDDGVNWTPHKISSDVNSPKAIVWAGNQYVVVFSSILRSSIIMTSPDGVDWTTRMFPFGDTKGIAWSGSLFASPAEDGTMLTSPDGLTWTINYTNKMHYPQGIVWTGKQFVAYGKGSTSEIFSNAKTENAVILTSPDGMTWTEANCKAKGDIYDMIWAGNKLVGVGQTNTGKYGLIITSTDGINWTDTVTEGENKLVSVAYSGKVICAVGTYNVTSTDGVKWKEHPKKENESMATIIWDGKRFVAGGFKNYKSFIITSSDGLNWTNSNMSFPKNLCKLEWTGSQYLGYGEYDYFPHIIISNDGINWTIISPKYTLSKEVSKVIKVGDTLICTGSDLVHGTGANTIGVNVNGTQLILDAPPKMVNGRVLVPLRAIFEALGAQVKWDANTQTITGTKDSKTIVLKVNSKNAVVSGKNTTLDVPAQIISGRTFVPVRFISESLGAEVNWDSDEKMVRVNN